MRRGPLIRRLFLTTLLGVIAAPCQQYPSPATNKNYPSAPAKVPVTHASGDAATLALGKLLFFDTRLSADQKVSCSSCHDPGHGFSDVRALSVGVFGRHPNRHTPTIIGRGIRTREGEPLEFWDGRAVSLEEQVLQPIVNPDEMGMTLESVLELLNQDRKYRLLNPGGLTHESLASALAGYVRTLKSEDSPLDRYLAERSAAGAYGERKTENDDGTRALLRDGLKDPGTNYYRPQDGHPEKDTRRDDRIGALELEGYRLFQDKARCYLCHSGPQFTDESFHNTGIAWREGSLQDEGRAAVDGKPYHKGAFKTPTLRDVARRGPYMHDGSLATLEEVIDYYDRGGNQNPHLDENIVSLSLTGPEKKALLAFLRTGLTGTMVSGGGEEPSQRGERGKNSTKK
jgi:cytochrome c peroxidase